MKVNIASSTVTAHTNTNTYTQTHTLTARHNAATCVIIPYWQVLTLFRRILHFIFPQKFHCFRQCRGWCAYWRSLQSGAHN